MSFQVRRPFSSQPGDTTSVRLRSASTGITMNGHATEIVRSAGGRYVFHWTIAGNGDDSFSVFPIGDCRGVCVVFSALLPHIITPFAYYF